MNGKLPILLLRIGLGISFIYPGVSMLRQPDSWIGWIPPFLIDLLQFDPKILLYFVAFFDVILGAAFLAGIFLKVTSLLGALHLLGILVFSGAASYIIIFRDIGLLFSSLALFFLTEHKR
ncbi:MAG: DoxX family membrane protein [Candidatus Paceibacteria bacterium]